MTKKDRIAVVISLFYLVVPISVLFEWSRGLSFGPALMFLFPMAAYWGYRFIKGDISFLGQSDV